MNKLMLDTNAYTHFIAGSRQVLNLLGNTDSVCMSMFVLGELYAGFRSGNRMLENTQLLRQFLSKPGVTTNGATPETAEIFGELKSYLRHQGTPVPINDVWIAAHAIEQGAVLATYDRHFERLPQVRLIWLIEPPKTT